jgi:hypothetical protein
MRPTSSFNILAVVLILVGISFMLENFNIVNGIWLIWPILTLILGAGFCMMYFRARRDLVLLGLGCFLNLMSMFFFYLNFSEWSLLAYLWPIFIVILGFTFLACFIMSRSRVLIYLATLLIAIGASFILIFAVSTRLWPISLVLAGISFIIISIFEHVKSKSIAHAKKR